MTGSLRAQTNIPTILIQPVGGAAAIGETFAFSVTAAGDPPLAHQWRLNGTGINAATNASLLLTNLTTGLAGGYSVVITNTAGSVTSSVASLSVVSTAPRIVWVKDVADTDGNTANVPLVLNANGREHSVQFSLRFDTNTFGSPAYEWSSGNLVSIVSSNEAMGQIGFTFARPLQEMFAPGQQSLGCIRFNLMGTNTTVLDGGLVFTNQPVAIQAQDTNGLVMLLSAAVVPQVQVAPVQPELSLQTGLFEQGFTIANPSGVSFQNLPVYIPYLGVDTSGNVISLHNASGSASVDLNGDGTFEQVAVLLIGSLPSGGIVEFTNGFYVTDHATSPVADYYVGIGGTPGVPMPATTVPLRITGARMEEAGFTLEWSTRPGVVYSVNYADNLTHLSNPVLVQTSTNTVTGSGSPAQWVDDSSSEVKRFYQLVEQQ